MSNYKTLFPAGSGLEGYADQLDMIQHQYAEGTLTEDEMKELVLDVKNQVEMDEAVASIQLTSDLLKVCATLAKLV